MSDLRRGSAAYYEELAEQAEKDGRLWEAIAHYDAAAAASMGKVRRARYQDKAAALSMKIDMYGGIEG